MTARNGQYRTLFDAQFSAGALAQARTALAGIPGAVDKAAAGAVNKTLAKGKTRLVKGLAAHLTIKQQNLRRRVFVVKASKTSPFGSIKLMGRPVGLINFETKDTKTHGVEFRITRGGQVFAEPDTFIATGKFGNRHVFHRKGRARLPIETDFSQRLFDLFFASPVPADLKAWLPRELDTQLVSQIDRFLSQDIKRR